MKLFSELTKKEKVIECLRWVCVLPAALVSERIGTGVTYFLVVRLVLNDLSYEGTDRWLRHLTGGFLGGAAFVVAGAATAPRFRRVTSITLFIWIGACVEQCRYDLKLAGAIMASHGSMVQGSFGC